MVKPKVLVISPARSLGGGEVYLQNLLPYLSEQFEVTVAGPRFAGRLFSSHARTRWLLLFPPSLEKLLRRTHQLKRLYYKLLISVCRLRKYDLINVQWFDGELIEAIKTRPLMLTLHTGFLIPRQYDAYVARVINSLSAVICVSEQAEQQLADRGVNTGLCKVVHNGIDLNKFQPAKDSGQYITWVGRVEQADKNPVLFVEIARQALAQNLPLKFRLVGNGSLLPKIRKSAPSNLEFLGQIEPAQMATIYHQASILCMTSDSEGLPLTALEAMASGVPVVATAVGGLTELITPASGILVKNSQPEDILAEITQLLEDQKRYQQMRWAARSRIESSFTLEKMASSTIALFNKVLQEKP